jgi:ubiquinol-cytochrome c reductase cytochrome c1 subunit
MRLAAIAILGVLAGASVAVPAARADEPPAQNWSFSGPFGTYDRASAQRGFQVYQEVCSACHAMKQMYYRNLEGIGLSPDQVKAIAASVTVPGGINDSGEPFDRPGLPSDHFKSPYPNDQAARAAQNGALPPDQSVLEKAREGGADYIYALLTGYRQPPAGMKMGDGMNYDLYFAGNQIAMPPPLSDGRVTYADGTPATVEQMARDVTTFLTFAANPEMEERKQIGVKIVFFLVLMTGVTYATKRRIWAKVH